MRKREPIANCGTNTGRQGAVRPTCEKSSPTRLRGLRLRHRQPDGHTRFAAAESARRNRNRRKVGVVQWRATEPHKLALWRFMRPSIANQIFTSWNPLISWLAIAWTAHPRMIAIGG